MAVRKRGDSWEVRFQVGGQRIERSLGSTATKADALEFEAKLRRDLIAGKLGRLPDRSLDEALLHWLKNEAAALKDYAGQKNKVRAIRPFTEGKRLVDIVQVAEEIKKDGQQIRLREDGKTRRLSPATINRRLAILRRIANLAHNVWGWIDQPLGQKIKLMPGEKARHVYLTPAQVEHLADCCEHPTVAIAIRLAARTGLRESELLRADALFDGCIVVTDQSKSGRPRLVPIPPDMAVALPLGITYATLRTYFEKARDKAEMPGVRFHDLRHTAASWWAQTGANLAVIRDLLGHANLAVTSRYSHLMTKDLKAVIDQTAMGLKRGKEEAQQRETSENTGA